MHRPTCLCFCPTYQRVIVLAPSLREYAGKERPNDERTERTQVDHQYVLSLHSAPSLLPRSVSPQWNRRIEINL
jgi:hypothetical protein